MPKKIIHQQIAEAVDFVRKRLPYGQQTTPEIGIILGSGLGSIADAMNDSVAIPYSEIPHFHLYSPTIGDPNLYME